MNDALIFVTDVSIWATFIAGILSFLSPCILPLIPSYIFFLSGASAANADTVKKQKIIIHSLLFICGFSLVFIMLGVTAGVLGQFLKENLYVVKKIAGVLIIIFGIHLSSVIQVNTLLKEKRWHFKSRPTGYLGSLLLGVAFAFGWTPCVGPILCSILAIAGTKETIWWGVLLLSVYSLGLAIPFFIVALSLKFFLKFFTKMKKHLPLISIISGLFLILIGIMMILDIF